MLRLPAWGCKQLRNKSRILHERPRLRCNIELGGAGGLRLVFGDLRVVGFYFTDAGIEENAFFKKTDTGSHARRLRTQAAEFSTPPGDRRIRNVSGEPLPLSTVLR